MKTFSRKVIYASFSVATVSCQNVHRAASARSKSAALLLSIGCERQQRRWQHCKRYVTKMFQNFGKVQPVETDLSCKSQKLMLYNEIIQPCHAGAFHFLPLGLRALEKLIKIIDMEMQAIGGQKITLPSLAPANMWKKSDRWNQTGAELFKLKDRHEQEYCLGPTHEELVTDLFSHISPVSYRRLPVSLYQVTKKFRDEMSPRYALLRGREFEMKDMYTFDTTEEKAKETYERVCAAYTKIFDRLKVPYVRVAGATGNIGGKLSHEFHFPADVGEDSILVCDRCGFGTNTELIDTVDQKEPTCFCPHKDSSCQLKKSAGIEVGHAFLLGTKYSSVFNATYLDHAGHPQLTQMGCYGLGVTRILQAAIEVLSIENQIRWPQLIAPYQICIIPQKEGYMAEKFMELAETLSDKLSGSISPLEGEIVIDDRIQLTVGKRLYEAKRLGYPYIVVVGKQALETPPLYELINTANSETRFIDSDQVCDVMSHIETV